MERLGKPVKSSVYGPFSFRQIAEFVVLLPLNFVPYVGVPLFLLLTGYRAGPLQHWRYFKLLNFNKKQRNAFVKRRRYQYTWYVRSHLNVQISLICHERYGTVYLFLQLVPGLSMLFLLTAAASSALWAADLEAKRREQEGAAVQAPQYTDEPPENFA